MSCGTRNSLRDGLVAVLCALVSQPSSLYAGTTARRCDVIAREMLAFGKRIEWTEISGLLARKGPTKVKQVPAVDVLGDNRPRVVIGFDKRPHMYVYSDRARFHGQLPQEGASPIVRKNTGLLEDGLAVELLNLSPGTAEALRVTILFQEGQLQEGKSCVGAGDRVLRKAGIHIGNWWDVLPSQKVTAVFQGRIWDGEGRRIEIRILSTNPHIDPLEIRERFAQFEQPIILTYGMGGMFVAAGAAAIWAWLNRDEEKSSEIDPATALPELGR